MTLAGSVKSQPKENNDPAVTRAVNAIENGDDVHG